MLDGGDHQIANVFGGDAAGDSDVSHGLAITAVERKGYAHLLAIVAGDLQRIRAPAGVTLVDRHAALMAPLLPT